LAGAKEVRLMKKLVSIVNRVLFLAAFVLAGVAVLEKLLNLFGFTLTILGPYGPSRLLELSAVALLFVIALQLREMKELERRFDRPTSQ
jgi:preprotein translocase subunit SecY